MTKLGKVAVALAMAFSVGAAFGEEPAYFTEYIRIVYGAYFDTGYKPNPKTTAILDVRTTELYNPYFFGVASDTFSYNAQITGGNKYSFYYKDGYSKGFGQSLTGRDKDQHRIFELNGKSGYFYLKNLTSGVPVTNNTVKLTGNAYSPATQTASANLYLFALNDNDTNVVYAVSGNASTNYRVYSMKLYDDGELVRDFRPCVSADGTACLYDQANHVLYRPLGTALPKKGVPIGSVGDVTLSPAGGDTDDAPAIQAALNGLGKDTLWLNPGTYNIATPVVIPKGASLVGKDRDACKLQLTGGIMKDYMFSVQEAAAFKNVTLTSSNPDLSTLDCYGAVHLKAEDYVPAGTLANVVMTGFHHRYGTSGHGNSTYYSGSLVRVAHAGTVINCVISNNLVDVSSGSNASFPGIFVTAGGSGTLIENTVIRGNKRSSGTFLTAALRLAGATTVRNCLIADNTHAKTTSAVYSTAVCDFCNCTIVNNEVKNAAVASYGAVTAPEGSVFRNCIIAGNTTDGIEQNVEAGSLATLDHCTAELPPFKDAEAGDYRVIGGTTIDAGVNDMSWMTDATDLYGNKRILDDVVDLGCSEFKATGLSCSVTGANSGLDRLTTTLSAVVKGPDQEGLLYSWALYDGETYQYVDDPTKASVDVTYDAPGTYAVTLKVRNAAGEAATSLPFAVTVRGSVVYVSTNSVPRSPYGTWETAAPDIATALSMSGSNTVIYVGEGTYKMSETAYLDEAYKVVGVGAPERIIFTPASGCNLLFNMTDAGSVLSGVTLRNASPRAVLAQAGVVSNCVFVGCKGTTALPEYSGGGALYLSGGVKVLGCLFTNNVFSLSGGSVRHGAALFAEGKGYEINSCRFVGNRLGTETATQSGKCGTAAYLAGSGVVRNCLFARQTSGADTTTVGTLYLAGSGTIEVSNCTFAENATPEAQTCAGLVSVAGVNAAISNCLFAANYNADGTSNISVGAKTTVTTCRFVDDVADFKRPNRGNYHLKGCSPALNAGTDAEWMKTATDLEGNPRIRQRAVDIGCYEDLETGFLILVR